MGSFHIHSMNNTLGIAVPLDNVSDTGQMTPTCVDSAFRYSSSDELPSINCNVTHRYMQLKLSLVQ